MLRYNIIVRNPSFMKPERKPALMPDAQDHPPRTSARKAVTEVFNWADCVDRSAAAF